MTTKADFEVEGQEKGSWCRSRGVKALGGRRGAGHGALGGCGGGED